MLISICFGISLILYAIILWNGMHIPKSNMFGFVILNFYIIIPMVSFMCALLLRLFNAPLKWVYPVLFAILGIAIPVIMVMRGVLILDNVWLLCVLPPFIGTILGWLIMLLKK